MFTFFRRLTLCTLILTLVCSAHADEITLKDGRVIKGTILRQSDQSGTILFRTQAGAARAEFELQSSVIKSFRYGELPADFWGQDGPVVKESESYRGDGTPFIECPISGVFGRDVFAIGIDKTLRYAVDKGIKEIVFTIDSEGQWDVDEIRKIINVLKKYDDQLTYNVLIKRSLGESLSFAVFADAIFFAPGAMVGGIPSDGGDRELASLNTAIARAAYEIMQTKGQSGRLIRAMIDPRETLSAWKNPGDKKMSLGIAVPADIPRQNVIFECAAGEILVLRPEMIRAAAVEFIASAAEIGKAKTGTPWVAYSQVGFTTMRNVRTRMAAEIVKQEGKTEKRVIAAVQRRDTLIEEYEHYIAQAQLWDPSKQKYTTRGRQHSSSKRFGGIVGNRRYINNNDDNYRDSTVLTGDSRKRWQEHSDRTIVYLTKAGNALSALRSAENRIADLGLERRYSDREIKIGIEDVATKIRHLRVMRDRRSK